MKRSIKVVHTTKGTIFSIPVDIHDSLNDLKRKVSQIIFRNVDIKSILLLDENGEVDNDNISKIEECFAFCFDNLSSSSQYSELSSLSLSASIESFTPFSLSRPQRPSERRQCSEYEDCKLSLQFYKAILAYASSLDSEVFEPALAIADRWIEEQKLQDAGLKALIANLDTNLSSLKMNYMETDLKITRLTQAASALLNSIDYVALKGTLLPSTIQKDGMTRLIDVLPGGERDLARTKGEFENNLNALTSLFNRDHCSVGDFITPSVKTASADISASLDPAAIQDIRDNIMLLKDQYLKFMKEFRSAAETLISKFEALCAATKGVSDIDAEVSAQIGDVHSREVHSFLRVRRFDEIVGTFLPKVNDLLSRSDPLRSQKVHVIRSLLQAYKKPLNDIKESRVLLRNRTEKLFQLNLKNFPIFALASRLPEAFSTLSAEILRRKEWKTSMLSNISDFHSTLAESIMQESERRHALAREHLSVIKECMALSPAFSALECVHPITFEECQFVDPFFTDENKDNEDYEHDEWLMLEGSSSGTFAVKNDGMPAVTDHWAPTENNMIDSGESSEYSYSTTSELDDLHDVEDPTRDIKEAINSLNAEIEMYKKNTEELEKKLSEANTEKETLQKEIESARSSIATLTSDLEDARASHEALEKTLAASIKEKEETITAHQNTLTEKWTERFSKSVAEKETLRSQLTSAESQVSSLEEQIQGLKQEITAKAEESIKTIKEKDLRIEDLVQQVTEMNACKQEMSAETRELRIVLAEKEAAFQRSSSESSNQVKALQAQISDVSDDRDDLMEQKVMLEQKLSILTTELEEMVMALEVTEAEKTDLSARHTAQTVELNLLIEELTTSTSHHQARIAELETELAKASERHEQSLLAIEALTSSVEDLKVASSSASQDKVKLQDLTEELTVLREAHAKSVAQIEAVSSRNAYLEAALGAQTLAGEKAEGRMKELEANHREAMEKLTKDKEALEVALNASEENYSTLSQELKKAEQRAEALGKERVYWRNENDMREIERLGVELNKAITSANDKTTQLENAIKELNQANIRVDHQRNVFATMEKEMRVLQSQVSELHMLRDDNKDLQIEKSQLITMVTDLKRRSASAHRSEEFERNIMELSTDLRHRSNYIHTIFTQLAEILSVSAPASVMDWDNMTLVSQFGDAIVSALLNNSVFPVSFATVTPGSTNVYVNTNRGLVALVGARQQFILNETTPENRNKPFVVARCFYVENGEVFAEVLN